MNEPQVFLVPYMDGAWEGYDPLNPTLGFPMRTPQMSELERNVRRAIDLMAEAVEGRFVFAAHTGVYCRELFYQEPLLSLYRVLVEQGGELAVHPHEEVIGSGTLVNSERHMRAIIPQKVAELRGAGLPVTAYRGGYSAYAACITPILEEAGIDIEMSATPGREVMDWNVRWKEAKTSAYLLCSLDPAHNDCGHELSSVLEIPLGWDGAGLELDSYLWNESADLDTLKATWDRILDRFDATGEPQFVHAVSHLFAMDDADFSDRLSSFLTYVQGHGGKVVTATEARQEFDKVRSSHVTLGETK